MDLFAISTPSKEDNAPISASWYYKVAWSLGILFQLSHWYIGWETGLGLRLDVCLVANINRALLLNLPR
jgi:hypothetical protein